MAHNDSLERALAPEPTKRKRSSILKQPDKRSRDSRTVSFNDKYFYKELYQDGTCDITNIFLGDDMDLTMMDIIDPVDYNNQTIDSSVDMSMDQMGTIVGSQSVDLTLMTQTNNNTQSMIAANTTLHDTTLDERDMISVNPVNLTSQVNSASQTSPIDPIAPVCRNEPASPNNTTIQANQTEPQTPQTPQASKTLHTSQINQTLQTSQISQLSQISQISEISSLDDTLFGAFHDSNNLSMLSNRTSGVDTLLHTIETMNGCIQKVDDHLDECKRRLDVEMEKLFRFYRHIINKNDNYEFAIAIFGLRHSLWLVIKVDPETYPNEKLKLRFAVRKQDRNLYPFKEYAEAVRRYTKEGSYGYLTRFVINAQRFRRFLKNQLQKSQL